MTRRERTLQELYDDVHRKLDSKPNERKTLEKYATNLTDQARNGELDPGIGRELETAQLEMILSKRKKANPILVGEAGVGKSQIVYDLAIRITAKDYNGPLKGKEIYEVSTTKLIAGCSFVGMSEKRMQSLIDEAMADPNIILFWDELHTIVGAGVGSKGTNDLANIVKPALAGTKLSIIGATTSEEYHIIQQDKALNRRFNKIAVRHLTLEEVGEVLKGIKYLYERHHGIMYNNATLRIMPHIAEKYSGLNNPDAAIDLMDTAGAIKANSPSRWEKHGNKVIKKDIALAAAILYSEGIDTINKYSATL